MILFDKNMTAVIKGVAIVFMIVLHVFGGQGWYESCYNLPMNDNELLLHFMGSLQICVGIYVFMIGFGYAFSKKKDFLYSIIHIKRLLTVFWTILLLFVLPVSINKLTSETGGGKLLLLNMFGIRETICWVSWFIFLYIWAMIIMPFAGRLIDNYPYTASILIILFSYTMLVAIWYFVPNFNQYDLWHTLFVCFSWTPTIVLGYVAARKNWSRYINLPSRWYKNILCIVVILMALYFKSAFGYIKIINLDILYAPVIILCVLNLFSGIRQNLLYQTFVELGNKSVYMWFIHALFFTAATRAFYQPFVMISDNLWIISLWTIILSYIIAVPLKKIIEI